MEKHRPTQITKHSANFAHRNHLRNVYTHYRGFVWPPRPEGRLGKRADKLRESLSGAWGFRKGKTEGVVPFFRWAGASGGSPTPL